MTRGAAFSAKARNRGGGTAQCTRFYSALCVVPNPDPIAQGLIQDLEVGVGGWMKTTPLVTSDFFFFFYLQCQMKD